MFIVHNQQTNTSLYECESCAQSVQEITAAFATGADIGASLIGDERKRTIYEELRQALTKTSRASAAVETTPCSPAGRAKTPRESASPPWGPPDTTVPN